MKLREIMSRSVETVGKDVSADAAWETMRTRRFHHLVVMDGKRIAGVISERDLGGTSGAALRKNRVVSDLISRDVIYAEADATLRKAANVMRGNSIGSLPVVEKGKLVGIVTTADLLELIGRGVEKPVVKTKRWTLKHRGLLRKKRKPGLPSR